MVRPDDRAHFVMHFWNVYPLVDENHIPKFCAYDII
jgi:hypothetical protein